MKITKLDNIYILTKKKFYKLYKIPNKKIIFTDSLNNLKNKNTYGENVLISCNTNVIIPEKIFNNFKLALNIHPGSYNFPGRDPHHWACYSNSNIFGATAHFIKKKVDSGQIIDFELVNIDKELSVSEYKNIGSKASIILMNRIVSSILKGFVEVKKKKWKGRVSKRIDLIKLCDFRGLDKKEIKRREASFIGFEKFYQY